jgi:hypothetical protein
MRRLVLVIVLVIAARAPVAAAEEPFSDGRVEIVHQGERRSLAYLGRNLTGKDVTRCVVAYVLKDQHGNALESDRLVLANPATGIVVPAGFSGVICAIPIKDEQIVSASFGFQSISFADGTSWTAPTAAPREPAKDGP